MNRRGFIKGVGLLLAAPAIVRVSSLMPVKSLVPVEPMGISEVDLLELVKQAYAQVQEDLNFHIQDRLYGDGPLSVDLDAMPQRLIKPYPWKRLNLTSLEWMPTFPPNRNAPVSAPNHDLFARQDFGRQNPQR